MNTNKDWQDFMKKWKYGQYLHIIWMFCVKWKMPFQNLLYKYFNTERL